MTTSSPLCAVGADTGASSTRSHGRELTPRLGTTSSDPFVPMTSMVSVPRAGGIWIRKFVGNNMKMRYVPQLAFFHDRSLEYRARIEETLKEIHHDLEKNPSDH